MHGVEVDHLHLNVAAALLVQIGDDLLRGLREWVADEQRLDRLALKRCPTGCRGCGRSGCLRGWCGGRRCRFRRSARRRGWGARRRRGSRRTTCREEQSAAAQRNTCLQHAPTAQRSRGWLVLCHVRFSLNNPSLTGLHGHDAGLSRGG